MIGKGDEKKYIESYFFGLRFIFEGICYVVIENDRF
jgi:hypothetical protein